MTTHPDTPGSVAAALAWRKIRPAPSPQRVIADQLPTHPTVAGTQHDGRVDQAMEILAALAVHGYAVVTVDEPEDRP